MANENFQTGDASPSNSEQKNFEWVMLAIQTANEKFRMDDASHSNG